jgi:DNA-binding transcriptional LysR family regulator
MDIRWLQDFLTLAETRNFTRAAARGNVSQAAFSRRIQALETWLGVPLVDRSAFPARLTPEGERFLPQAAETLRQMLDARAGLGDAIAREGHIRIGLPFALATARFAEWWAEWSGDAPLSAAVTLGNVHDLVTALVSEAVDILVLQTGAQQPVHLDAEGFERIVIGADALRPYASQAWLRRERLAFPGSDARPLPLLLYTPGVYFARLVTLALERAPQRLAGRRVLESDMADVLRASALAGQGVTWLPDSTVAGLPGDLVALGGAGWSMPLSVVAFRSRRPCGPAVERLWSAMVTAGRNSTLAAAGRGGAGKASRREARET